MEKVWQKEDWKWLFLQAQSQPIHTGWVKAHANGQASQDNLKVFQLVKVKLPQTGIVPMTLTDNRGPMAWVLLILMATNTQSVPNGYSPHSELLFSLSKLFYVLSRTEVSQRSLTNCSYTAPCGSGENSAVSASGGQRPPVTLEKNTFIMMP